MMVKTATLLAILLLLVAACGGVDDGTARCSSQYDGCAPTAEIIVTYAALDDKTGDGPVKVRVRPGATATPRQ